MRKKLSTVFLIIILILPTLNANALTSTSLTLEKYVGDTYEIGKEIQFSARLLDNSSNYIANKPVNLYYKVGSTGTWTYVDTKYTDAIGYASFYFTAGTVGAYIFRANFTGDATYSSSVSNEVSITFVLPQTTTTTIPSSPSTQEGWGSVEPYGFTAELVNYSGDWSALTPLNLIAVTNGSASWKYNVNPLSQFDIVVGEYDEWDYLDFYKEYWYNYTVEVDGYVVQDIKHYGIRWIGLFPSAWYERTIKTITPNGTIFDFDAKDSLDDPLRLVFYKDDRGYLIFAWTLEDIKSNDWQLAVLHSGQATAWKIGQDFDVTINHYLKVGHKNYKRVGAKVEVKACSISTATCSAYTLLLAPQSSREQPPQQRSVYDNVQALVSGFIRSMPSWVAGGLNAIGLGWLVEATAYFGVAFKIIFNVIVLTLPYIGLIFFIINLKYIATLDFAGLFEFYMQLYQIAANIFAAITNVIQWTIDGIKSLAGILSKAG
ncbi:MAG: Ig-like domain repeat protein [Nitrososphaeria archaeon]|nr:Ig-like domain repeat protein [Nitrososphaeria archaeon]